MVSMLPPRPSALSGHIKLCFLTLAVFVVLAHTSPGNQNGGEKTKGELQSAHKIFEEVHPVGVAEVW